MAEEERRVWLEEAMNRWETSLLRLCFHKDVGTVIILFAF